MSVRTFETFTLASYQRMDKEENSTFVKRRVENLLWALVEGGCKLSSSVTSIECEGGWRTPCYVTFKDGVKLEFQNFHKITKYDRGDNCRIGVVNTSNISRGIAIKDILLDPTKEYSIHRLRGQFDELCETIRKRIAEYKTQNKHQEEIKLLTLLGKDLYKDENVYVAVNVRNSRTDNKYKVNFDIRVFNNDIADVDIDEDGKNLTIKFHSVNTPNYRDFENFEQVQKFTNNAIKIYELGAKKVKEILAFIEKIKEDMQIIYKSYNPEKKEESLIN